MSDQTSAVRAVIQDYFDALYDGDVEKFGRVFHSACRLFTAVDEGVMTLDYDAYLKRVGGVLRHVREATRARTRFCH